MNNVLNTPLIDPTIGFQPAKYLWHTGQPDARANFETLALPIAPARIGGFAHLIEQRLQAYPGMSVLPSAQWHIYLGSARGVLADGKPARSLGHAFEVGFTKVIGTDCSIRLLPATDDAIRAIARKLKIQEREWYGLTIAYAHTAIDPEESATILSAVRATLGRMPVSSMFDRVELRSPAPNDGYRIRESWPLSLP